MSTFATFVVCAAWIDNRSENRIHELRIEMDAALADLPPKQLLADVTHNAREIVLNAAAIRENARGIVIQGANLERAVADLTKASDEIIAWMKQNDLEAHAGKP